MPGLSEHVLSILSRTIIVHHQTVPARATPLCEGGTTLSACAKLVSLLTKLRGTDEDIVCNKSVIPTVVGRFKPSPTRYDILYGHHQVNRTQKLIQISIKWFSTI